MIAGALIASTHRALLRTRRSGGGRENLRRGRLEWRRGINRKGHRRLENCDSVRPFVLARTLDHPG